ncbi:MAG: hypothetical protein ETSY2_45235 [Candidatus Entotheonella gemina]|uniref:DUF5615 domain-containing protein n=1 Tax=Candidatus Entotheonella gemina TaxID=1429439 RepID=W4LH77_9BACT|nr:MAG: hypothetical protein ETSY2_45235 [Candidatus Entotheonella gemina]
MDDDTADRRLVVFLSRAGHRVIVPAEVQLRGASDAQHLIYAMQRSLVIMTRNHDDFLDLHDVVRTAQGYHPGIIVIRLDNDSKRDMTHRQIVTALSRLESSGVPLMNQFYILNHWR